MTENAQKCATKLHSRQLHAVRLVAWGKSARDIERLLGISQSTLYRWKQLPEFITECEAIIETQYEEMRHRMRDIALSSVETVWLELQNHKESSKRIQVAMNMIKLLGIANPIMSDAQHGKLPGETNEPATN